MHIIGVLGRAVGAWILDAAVMWFVACPVHKAGGACMVGDEMPCIATP